MSDARSVTKANNNLTQGKEEVQTRRTLVHDRINVFGSGNIVELGAVTKRLATGQVGPVFVMLDHYVAMLLKDLVRHRYAIKSNPAKASSVESIQGESANQGSLISVGTEQNNVSWCQDHRTRTKEKYKLCTTQRTTAYFACSTWSHNGEDMSPLDSAGDVGQDTFLRVALSDDKVDVLKAQDGTLHTGAVPGMKTARATVIIMTRVGQKRETRQDKS